MSKIEDRVCARIQQRAKLGLDKYGVTLENGNYSESELLRHAQEEALDLANYLEAVIVEKTKTENERIPVLDKGYVQLIETWGSDARIVESARMSTGKGFLGWGTVENPGDEKLLKYLWDNQHNTPFEFAGMTLEVKAPIFVFREWHRHRTQVFNEASARYTPLPDDDYLPTRDRVLSGANNPTDNKQAGGIGNKFLTEPEAVDWLNTLDTLYDHAQNVYRIGLELGVPKELARLALPVGRYSRMRVSANLRNWLAFLTLRMDESAQWEIRQYAGVVCDLIAEKFPRTHKLYMD